MPRYVPLESRRLPRPAFPWSAAGPAVEDEACGPNAAAPPSILLIDAVERRIRSLGHEPVRSFDARRRWRIHVDDEVIATGMSLAELARAADAWLAGRGGGSE